MGSHKKEKQNKSSETSKHKKSKKNKIKKHKRKHKKHTTSSPSSEAEKQKKLVKKLEKTKKKTKNDDLETSTDIPVALMTSNKSMAPMTKEEWEKRQSETRRVFDESTGRYRLIKGDGEVIEEIVSRDRHKAINQQATRGDGVFFQSLVNVKLKK